MPFKPIRSLLRYVQALSRLTQLQPEIDALRNKLETLSSRIDVSDELFEEFQQLRYSLEYNRSYEKKNPLVSVCVGTYNRAELVVNRCIKSILDQDYDNLEVIVVGDCCTDETSLKISAISDPRLRFFNLPQRGRYPENSEWRWMVAGTLPFNYALSLASGDFITHLDDDDRYAPDRIRRLVTYIQTTRADFVWHPFWQEADSAKWILRRADQLAHGQVTTSSIFYHHWLAKIPWDTNAYRYREPGDYNRIRKLKYLGVTAQRFPEPLVWHYKERNQKR